MSTPDPRTERAQLDKWLLQTNRYPGTVTAGEAAQHLYDAAVKANDALTTEAARVRGETWREAKWQLSEKGNRLRSVCGECLAEIEKPKIPSCYEVQLRKFQIWPQDGKDCPAWHAK